jgi:hypothetical protein
MSDGERKLSYYGLALPICRLRQEKDEHGHVISEILGTCFGIGNVYLMTAAHVISELISSQSDSVVLLQNPETKVFYIARVVDTETLDADVGIVQINPREGNLWFARASWSAQPLSEFERIRAVGYPYGLHVVGSHTHIVQRGFEGHVVAHLREYLPLGMTPPSFSAYELSFAAPRGLSGAPVWTPVANNLRVHGIVIGNNKSRTSVLSGSEQWTDKDGQGNEKVTIIETYEWLTLGIAVDGPTIKQLKSELLGTTIGETSYPRPSGSALSARLGKLVWQ